MEKSVSDLEHFKETLGIETEPDASQYSPLVLAYIGDAVYEIMIRTKVVSDGNTQVKKMHKHTAELVKAGAQADILVAIWDDLTEEEKEIAKRGRNAHSRSVAKNASAADYRAATGFEALVGYLYLADRPDRLGAIVSLGLKRTGELKENTGEDTEDAI